MQFNSQRFQQLSTKKEDEPKFEQYFGEGNVFDLEKTSGGNRAYRPPVKETTLLDTLSVIDRFPIHGRAGFMVLFILHLIFLPIFLWGASWSEAGLSVLVAGGILFLWKQVRFQSIEHLDHYIGNVVTTLKAFLKQGEVSRKLFNHSTQLMMIGWGVLLGNTLVLSFLLPHVWKDALFLISLFLFAIGLILKIIIREWELSDRMNVVICMTLLLDVFLSSLRGEYAVLSVFTFAILWFVGSHLHLWRED